MTSLTLKSGGTVTLQSPLPEKKTTPLVRNPSCGDGQTNPLGFFYSRPLPLPKPPSQFTLFTTHATPTATKTCFTPLATRNSQLATRKKQT
ncbi:hypothetical protein VNO78_09819 [Psophocarpus tetragonolobus]|uniref:Uncharacterized protein n=1 Tax=Psophocarpus tetragonolobus TaxID=3891 RepID=A0AAN9SXX3_PSOTE